MLKKKLILLFFIILIWVPITLVFIVLNNDDSKPKFTDEELSFIKENKDTIFLTGYFPAERKFAKKLCEKIEEDTSLKLRIYDDTWNNSLYLLEKGKLPIVMNMNRTKQRETYAYFTNPLMPIPCGIYSSLDNEISSFEDIRGKVIGVEKKVALLDTFTQEYPTLEYEVIIFDTFEETREAFANGEIDCFLSTKSYDKNVKGLHFFEIETITQGTNHIGVSKDYPILYSILDKEVNYLKQQNMDILIYDIIRFELEKSLVEFSKSEVDYLNEKQTLVVGLPEEYFLYAYGEEYNTKGIIPEIIEKIEFICDCDFTYRFDSLKNLRLRNDVDFYIDNIISKDYTSSIVFGDDIIVVGTSDKKIINEVYELAHYNVGVLGVPNDTDYLLQEMPNICAKDFMDFETGSKAIENREIDYLIVPKRYFLSIVSPEFLEIRGELKSKANRFVSDDKICIEIINKCLSIIDIQKVIHYEMQQTSKANKPYVIVIYLLLLIGISVILRKLYVYFRKLYYLDNEYGLYNLKYLQKNIKNQEAYLILLEIINANDVRYYYGEKIFNKYIKIFIERIEALLLENEYVIYVNSAKFIVVKEYNEDVLEFCNAIDQKIMLRNITLNYNLNVAYIDYQDTFHTMLNKLNLALYLAQEKNKIIYFNEQMQSYYKKNMARDESIKIMINEERVELLFSNIMSKNGELFGRYVSRCTDEVAHKVLYKIAKRLNLVTKLDKFTIKAVTSKTYERQENIFIDISEETLLADGFFDWVDSQLAKNNNISLFFITSTDVLERNIEILEENRDFNYVIKNFGNDLKGDCLSKYYDVEYLLLDGSLTNDLEINEEVLDFIMEFAIKNNKKIISTNRCFKGADYYIEEEQ